MPRVVNFITGPSRTADIEQRIELGRTGLGVSTSSSSTNTGCENVETGRRSRRVADDFWRRPCET